MFAVRTNLEFLKDQKPPCKHSKKRKKKKLLMEVLCAMQPRVVRATRPHIYDQVHTIMNNARYGRTAQRIHGAVSSLRIGHSLTFNGSLYSLVLCLFLWHALLLVVWKHAVSFLGIVYVFWECTKFGFKGALQSWKLIVSYFDNWFHSFINFSNKNAKHLLFPAAQMWGFAAFLYQILVDWTLWVLDCWWDKTRHVTLGSEKKKTSQTKQSIIK